MIRNLCELRRAEETQGQPEELFWLAFPWRTVLNREKSMAHSFNPSFYPLLKVSPLKKNSYPNSKVRSENVSANLASMPSQYWKTPRRLGSFRTKFTSHVQISVFEIHLLLKFLSLSSLKNLNTFIYFFSFLLFSPSVLIYSQLCSSINSVLPNPSFSFSQLWL